MVQGSVIVDDNNNLGSNEEHYENEILGEDTEQHAGRNMLKEDLQIKRY